MKIFLVILLCLVAGCLVAGAGFAQPVFVSKVPDVASWSCAAASDNIVSFIYPATTNYVQIYNSSTTDKIYVNLNEPSMRNASQNYVIIPPAKTLELNYRTSNMAITGTGRTAGGAQVVYVYVTFE